LSISDSKKSLKILGIDAKSDEIERFVSIRGGEEKELLDENSFLRFAATKLVQIENAHKAFGLIDKDEKGVVVLQDLQRVAQELGEDFTEEELTEMIELVDRDGDGLLRAKDFVRIASKVNLK
jgi:Ca2+-binding EF-hand superfamily protein